MNEKNSFVKNRYEIIGREQVENGVDHLLEPYYDQLPFSVDESRGHLRVSDTLDYEYKRSYTFFVRVRKLDLDSDQHLSSRSNLLLQWTQFCLVKLTINVIDLNDNQPEFSSRNQPVIQVVEGSERGTVLGQLVASDADSKLNSVVRYELRNGRDIFSMDSKLGLLQLNLTQLDREELSRINLTVRAYNLVDQLGTERNVEVEIIDLNDNRPRFDRTEYFISVEENSPNGFLLTQLTAIDPDLNSTTELFYSRRRTWLDFLII